MSETVVFLRALADLYRSNSGQVREITNVVDQLERACADVESLKAHLREYGEHKWKCAVSVALRKDKMCPACDCGWQALIGSGGIYHE